MGGCGGCFIIFFKFQKQVSLIKIPNLFFDQAKAAGTQDNKKTEQCNVMIGCGWVGWYRSEVGGWWWTEPYTDVVHPVISSLV